MKNIGNEKLELLTNCEELVAIIIWDSYPDQLSLTEIMQKVNSRFNKEWKPQTVSTFLARLVTKGYLSSYRQGRVFYYIPDITKETYASIKLAEYCELYGIPSKEDLKKCISHLKTKRVPH